MSRYYAALRRHRTIRWIIQDEYYDELEESGYSDEVCDKVIAELKPENLPKQFFFRTKEAVNTLSFDKVKRQVIG